MDQPGKIIRCTLPDTQSSGYVEMYLGSGRMGGVFDAYGFMNTPMNKLEEPLMRMQDGKWQGAVTPSSTVFMHANHWVKGAYGLQGFIPPARLLMLHRPETIDHYYQEHDIYTGTLTTELDFCGVTWRTVAGFNPESRDVLTIQVEYTAMPGSVLPGIRLEAITSLMTFYQTVVSGTLRHVMLDNHIWQGRLRVGNADTALGVHVLCQSGDIRLDQHESGVDILPWGTAGRFILSMGISAETRSGEMMQALQVGGDALDVCRSAWKQRRGSANIRIPDDRWQALFDRSVYYMLSSLSPDVMSPPPPVGWTAFAWSFHFPQDLSYVFPCLLRLGFLDIARAKVEFYHRCLPSVRRCTRRIYGVTGAMWPWEHPVSTEFSIMEGSAPNWYQFEIHNAAYPARMAYETALFGGMDAWAREHAWPVVRASAQFFASIAKREPDTQRWSLFVNPSMGQDEYGGTNDRNFLCSLFAAQYCFESALDLAKRLDIPETSEMKRWSKILQDGLSYDRLLDERYGILQTHEHLEAHEGLLEQKHPVQLNPLMFLPLSDGITPELKNAYAMRYDLCIGLDREDPQGWTLPAFLLAGSHIGDADGLRQDLDKLISMRNTDPALIQIYEATRIKWGKYYLTSHGLFMQALCGALLSDYWGEVQIGTACPAEWERAGFSHLHARDGSILSGSMEHGTWTVSNDT